MNKRFEVVDACNCYMLYDLVTGRGAAMGDGVDQPYGEVGTDLFRDRWEDDVNSAVEEVFDAYFGDLSDLLIFDGGDKYADRYTVVLHPVTSLCGMSDLQAEISGDLGSLHHCLSVSHCDPEWLGGFSQYGTCHPTFMAETQKQIHFLDMPEVTQRHVARRLEED